LDLPSLNVTCDVLACFADSKNFFVKFASTFVVCR
jgi:hypothetical protein